MGTIHTAAIVSPLYERDSNQVRNLGPHFRTSKGTLPAEPSKSQNGFNIANVADKIYSLDFENHFNDFRLEVLIP